MWVFIVLVLLSLLVYYFFVYYPTKGGGVVEDSNKDYVILYDPIKDSEGSSFSYTYVPIQKRLYVVSNIDILPYNDGEVNRITVSLDGKWPQMGDIITIGNKLSFILSSRGYKNGLNFNYGLIPTKRIFSSDLNYIRPGEIAFRDIRELTDKESEYLRERKVQESIERERKMLGEIRKSTRSARYGGNSSHSVSRSHVSNSNYSSNTSDPIDDILYNPLLSPISPISIWDSGGYDDSSSSSSSSSSWDSSSSYDSGSSDSDVGD